MNIDKIKGAVACILALTDYSTAANTIELRSKIDKIWFYATEISKEVDDET